MDQTVAELIEITDLWLKLLCEFKSLASTMKIDKTIILQM